MHPEGAYRCIKIPVFNSCLERKIAAKTHINGFQLQTAFNYIAAQFIDRNY